MARQQARANDASGKACSKGSGFGAGRLQDFGWSEGRNIRFDYRFTEDSTERMRTAAAEVVGMAPDVIFVWYRLCSS